MSQAGSSAQLDFSSGLSVAMLRWQLQWLWRWHSSVDVGCRYCGGCIAFAVAVLDVDGVLAMAVLVSSSKSSAMSQNSIC